MSVRIELSRGKFALIDDDDYPLVSRFKWSYDKNGYVVRKIKRNGRQKKILLHRFLRDAPAGFDVDHTNKHKLDNRRKNLRLATRSQNNANSGTRANSTSHYKGVSWNKRDKVWRAGICVNGDKRYLGSFRDEVEAAKAYDCAAREAWGDFAYQNFPAASNE